MVKAMHTEEAVSTAVKAAVEAAVPPTATIMGWRIDKNIPLSIILVILTQTIVFTAIVSSKITQLDSQDKRLEKIDLLNESVGKAIIELTRVVGQEKVKAEGQGSEISSLKIADQLIQNVQTLMLQQLGRIEERTNNMGTLLGEVRSDLRAVANTAALSANRIQQQSPRERGGDP